MDVSGLIIFYIIFGFFAFCMLLAVGIMFHFYRRRKLTFTNFLSADGKWERAEWKPKKLDKTFEYDGQMYKFDIKKCTRDTLNRPIAHYYKGNPEQQIFNLDLGNIKLHIGTNDFTGKDFITMMKSKVLRDIFEDGEVTSWLVIILVAVIVCTIILGILIYSSKPEIVLKADNETISTIAQGVRVALQRG